MPVGLRVIVGCELLWLLGCEFLWVVSTCGLLVTVAVGL